MPRSSPEVFSAYVLGALTFGGPFLLHLLLAIDWLPAWLININLTTFGAYAYDKRAARRGLRRIPERLLHILGLLGGSPAALFAQRFLRHKTAKFVFQATFWLIFAAQIALLLWYYGSLPL